MPVSYSSAIPAVVHDQLLLANWLFSGNCQHRSFVLLLPAVYTRDRSFLYYFPTTATGVAPFKLLVQNDGNVRILDSRGAQIWQTNTAGS